MLMIIHPMLSEETIKEVLKELEKVPAELSLCVIDNEILANASKCHILVTSDEDHSWYQMIYYKNLALWKNC